MGEKFLSLRNKKINKTMGSELYNTSYEGEIINLGIGDLDINTNQLIINEAFQDAKNGHTHYTDSRGDIELREEILKYHREEFKNYNFNDNEIMVVSGGCHGMYLLLKSIIDKNDEIIVFSPYFPVYIEQIKLCNGKTKIVKLKEKDEYQINKIELLKKISNKTKAIIINTPSNPTGACLTKKSLEIIKGIAKEYDLLVIADDVYDYFSYEEEFIPFYTLSEMKKRTAVVCSFSKNFAMTGWRIGYVIASKEIINCMKNINDNIIYSTSSISQRAALSALRNRKSIKNELISIYRERMEYSYKRVINIKNLSLSKPKGGIYLFINIKKTGMDTKVFIKEFYEKYGVLVLDGTSFGNPHYIRICVNNNMDVLNDAFNRLEKMVTTN